MNGDPQPFDHLTWVRRDNALFEKVDRFMTPKTYIDASGRLIPPAYHEGRIGAEHGSEPFLQVRGKVPDKVNSPFTSFTEVPSGGVSPASYGRDAIVVPSIAYPHAALLDALRDSAHPERGSTATYTRTGENWTIAENAQYKPFAEQYRFPTTGPLTEVQRTMVYSTHDKEALAKDRIEQFELYVQTDKAGVDPRFGAGTYVKLGPEQILAHQRDWEARGAMQPSNAEVPKILEKYGRPQANPDSVPHDDVRHVLTSPALDKADESALKRENKFMQMRKDGISVEQMPTAKDVNRPGHIADIDDKSVFLDVGRKHQIEIPLTALQGAPPPAIGEEVRLIAEKGKATLTPTRELDRGLSQVR